MNIEELYLSQPDTGEQALEITEALVQSGAIDVIVIDSVAALVPKSELEENMGGFTYWATGKVDVSSIKENSRCSEQKQLFSHLY